MTWRIYDNMKTEKGKVVFLKYPFAYKKWKIKFWMLILRKRHSDSTCRACLIGQKRDTSEPIVKLFIYAASF